MWWGKKKYDTDKPEKAEKSITPFTTKYGTWCRTRLLKHNDVLPLEYLEAFQQSHDPADNSSKWCVRKVEQRTVKGRAMNSYSKLFTDLHFLEAINHLSHYEGQAEALSRELVDKTAEEIGSVHFRVFAECEGIIFNEHNFPHFRNANNATPDLENHFSRSNTDSFFQDDLESAEKHYQTAKSSFTEHQKDTENTLQRLFNNQSHIGNFEKTLQSFEEVGSLVAPIERLEELYEKMRDIEGDSSPSDGVYLRNVENLYDEAHKSFNNLGKGHSLFSSKTDDFLNYCKISIYTLSAQSLFQEQTRCDTGSKAKEINETMRSHIKQIEKLCKKQPGFDQSYTENIKQMILKGDRPKIPVEITRIIKRLKTVHRQLKNKEANPYSNIDDILSLNKLDTDDAIPTRHRSYRY